MVFYDIVEFFHLGIGYVRRVGYDEVEFSKLRDVFSDVTLNHRQAFRFQSLCSDIGVRCLYGNITYVGKNDCRVAVFSYDLIGDRYTDAARACAEICKSYICIFFVILGYSEDVACCKFVEAQTSSC